MRWLTWGLINLLLGSSIQPLAASTKVQTYPSSLVCPQNLPVAIAKIIDRPKLKRSRWGIVVQTLESRRTLYSRHADEFFIPASNVKLLTTAAALIVLGRDYRIYTPIYVRGMPPNLISLRLEGRGDPTITTKTLKNIVRVLRREGIERIENLIIDDSYFATPAINPTWEWSDIHSYYGTSVTSLILNENSVTLTVLPQQLGQKVKLAWSDRLAARQWRVVNNAITAAKDTPYELEIDGVFGKASLNIRGKLAINEPPDIWDLAIVEPQQYFLATLRHLLATEGITVAKTTVDNSREPNVLNTKRLSIVSPSLAEIITTINRQSNNLYAESVWKILEKLDPKRNTNIVETKLKKLGINANDYLLVDGSGLSRHNLITPQALVNILSVMSRSPVADIYKNSLAVAGVNGTLKNRFQDTPMKKKLWGKTGTLTGVIALSGYLEPTGYEPIAFSIIVNNSERSNKELRQAIDEIVLLIGQLENCQI